MRSIWLLLLIISGTALSESTDKEPEFLLAENGVLNIGIPAPILERPDVREQLETGLTTTFVIKVQIRMAKLKKKLRGACRIDIRFEPWDQVYFINVWQYNGTLEKITLSSFEDLKTWFAAFHAGVIQLDPSDLQMNPGHWIIETHINLLPFSQREVERTQRWFHQHLGNKTSTSRDPNKVLDLLVASSIRRKSLVQFTFRRTFRP